jgi:hypothetical protein
LFIPVAGCGFGNAYEKSVHEFALIDVSVDDAVVLPGFEQMSGEILLALATTDNDKNKTQPQRADTTSFMGLFASSELPTRKPNPAPP